MKCAVHTEVDAIGYCRNCGKPLCAQCERDVRGALYCEDCLAAKVFSAPAATAAPFASGASTAGPVPATALAPNPAVAANAGSPGLALALGFIPGLGAVYNGEYLKALVHVLIFGSLIAAHKSDMPGGFHAVLSLAISCFYFYMPIEAFRTAKARRAGIAGPALEEESLPADPAGRKPTGAFILIGLGVFLLLANLGLFDWEWFGKLWPVGLVALGVWILARRYERRSDL